MTQIVMNDVARETDRLLDVGRRIDWHVETEMSDVDVIMSSVTPEEQLTWMRNLAWSAPYLEGSGVGNPQLLMSTTYDTVVEHYETNRLTQQMPPGSKRLPGTDIRTSWYGLLEVFQARALNTLNGQEYVTDAVVLIAIDGEKGISSEIGWAPLSEVDLSKVRRIDILTDYVDALKAADTDRLMASMGDNVQGAVRGYFGWDDEFVLLNGRAPMESFYTKFFDAADIVDVNIINSLVREWYIFMDLAIDIRLKADGSTQRFRTAEIFGLESDGRFASRSGYGTPTWPQ